MNKNELNTLRLNDVVIISVNSGKNIGKRCIVTNIVRINGGGNIWVKPLEGKFEFSKGQEKIIKDGACWWSHYSLQLEGKLQKGKTIKEEVKKDFYVEGVYNKPGMSWSASNFTSKELLVISRFLQEFNDKMDDQHISILDEDNIF